MIKNTNRQVFSENLRMALLADEIASSLRHIRERKQLTAKDELLLDKAVELVDEIRRGRDATKNKKIEEGSLEASLAYGQAIRAFRLMPLGLGPFETFFENLQESLKDVRRGQKFNVEEAYQFFTAVGKAAMAASARKFEYVHVTGVE